MQLKANRIRLLIITNTTFFKVRTLKGKRDLLLDRFCFSVKALFFENRWRYYLKKISNNCNIKNLIFNAIKNIGPFMPNLKGN